MVRDMAVERPYPRVNVSPEETRIVFFTFSYRTGLYCHPRRPPQIGDHEDEWGVVIG